MSFFGKQRNFGAFYNIPWNLKGLRVLAQAFFLLHCHFHSGSSQKWTLCSQLFLHLSKTPPPRIFPLDGRNQLLSWTLASWPLPILASAHQDGRGGFSTTSISCSRNFPYDIACVLSTSNWERRSTTHSNSGRYRNLENYLFWPKNGLPYLLRLKNPILGKPSLPSLGIPMQMSTELNFLSCSTGDRGHWKSPQQHR